MLIYKKDLRNFYFYTMPVIENSLKIKISAVLTPCLRSQAWPPMQKDLLLPMTKEDTVNTLAKPLLISIAKESKWFKFRKRTT